MRIDVISIFPEYLQPLQLSLLGRAQDSGLLDLHTHDLRRWTQDRHHSVDDTPYGGGPGMVLKPDPWGEAIDEVAAGSGDPATLVVTTPSGATFGQALAERLAQRERLVIACGRYEGIDQRVVDHFSTRMPTEEVSIGDVVLNGGEAAALVIVEAVARLVPGFLGNSDSLLEESHARLDGPRLLECPVYTKPPSWRGIAVPPVLLSGHHAQITAWRRDQARRRTAQRRPDLLHPSQTLSVSDLDAAEVRVATGGDAGEILTLQRCCWVSEAQANETVPIPALHESLDDVRAALEDWTTVVVRSAGRLVASVRAREEGQTWHIGRLMVAPDLEGRGLGRWLLTYIETTAPEGTTGFAVVTGAGSERNLRLYRRAGYRRVPEKDPEPGVAWLGKTRRPPRRQPRPATR